MVQKSLWLRATEVAEAEVASARVRISTVDHQADMRVKQATAELTAVRSTVVALLRRHAALLEAHKQLLASVERWRGTLAIVSAGHSAASSDAARLRAEALMAELAATADKLQPAKLLPTTDAPTPDTSKNSTLEDKVTGGWGTAGENVAQLPTTTMCACKRECTDYAWS